MTYSLHADWLAEPPRLVRTYYRSFTSDGRLWCESKDSDEVIGVSKGQKCTFERVEYFEITDGWQPWEPQK